MSVFPVLHIDILLMVAGCRTVRSLLVALLAAWHLLQGLLTCCAQEMAAAGGEDGGRE